MKPHLALLCQILMIQVIYSDVWYLCVAHNCRKYIPTATVLDKKLLALVCEEEINSACNQKISTVYTFHITKILKFIHQMLCIYLELLLQNYINFKYVFYISSHSKRHHSYSLQSSCPNFSLNQWNEKQ